MVWAPPRSPLLRGSAELRRFLDRYVDGPSLLAEGTETAATEDRLEEHPYRMTMLCKRSQGRWLPMQVHGSSPH